MTLTVFSAEDGDLCEDVAGSDACIKNMQI